MSLSSGSKGHGSLGREAWIEDTGLMLKRPNSIVFLASSLDACAAWRCHVPHLNIPGSSFFIFPGPPDWKMVLGHDTVIVQRMCTQPQFDFMKMAKMFGMKVVQDLDDNVWELPDYNPAQSVFHHYRQGFIACLQAADVISVSTPGLADTVRRWVQPLKSVLTGKDIPVVVVANKLDSKVFAPPVPPKNPLIVGWAGSNSHLGDLQLAAGALKAIKQECPEIAIQIRGCPSPREIESIVEFEQWMPVPEFGSRMPTWGWSVGLAPLVQCNFNNSKSNIKILEAAYCKVPVLASPTSTYAEFCGKDKELEWLLCPNPPAWKRKLRDLVHDKDLRQHYGEASHRVLMEHYSWSKPHEGWNTLLETVRNI